VSFVVLRPVAAAPVNAAGVVIDYGDGRVTYAYVPFDGEKISGIELLKRSGVPLLTVSFGGLGDAVCTIDDTGCGMSDCRKRLCQTGDPNSPFWHYLKQTKPGTWTFVATGPSAQVVQNGDIIGWAWAGQTPALPAMTMDQLIARTGAAPVAQAKAGTLPPAAVLTTGQQPKHGGQSMRQYLAGGVALLIVAGLGGFAVWRSRRVRREASP
jgi:hypothetical protein